LERTKPDPDLIKACIFDLDGVIVDTARYHYLAWKKLAKELGVDLTLEDNERLKGVSRMRSLEIILEIGGITLNDHEKERLANKKNEWFVDYVDRMAPEEIYPGVKGMLRSMRALGFKIALASSSKNAKTVIQLLHIRDEFDTIVDGTMITHTKPHPEIFLKAASQLGIAPENCVVFEDAEAGIAAAIAAGMKCVGVGSPVLLKDANRIVSTTSEFQLAELNQL
jgi:beta-phosphoglucomutase